MAASSVRRAERAPGVPFGATLGRFQHNAPARRIKPSMVGRGRTVILIHGRNVKTRFLHNAAKAQKKAKRAGLFWNFLDEIAL
jgi:hypothetical protein